MSTKSLGRLQQVNLREAWFSESIDFTPWLAQEENLKLLSDVICFELELESQKNVGPFRADILCEDTATGLNSYGSGWEPCTRSLHLS